MSERESRTEWAVRMYQYVPVSDERQAEQRAAAYREHGNPEAVVVRREVTTETEEWWEPAMHDSGGEVRVELDDGAEKSTAERLREAYRDGGVVLGG